MDEEDEPRWTDLQLAAKDGDIGRVQLACGRVEERDENEANESDQAETWGGVVELLLAAGANIHTPADRYCGRTALQAAAERGSLRCVRRLLLLSADVNASPSTTAGLVALQAAYLLLAPLAVVQALLEAGADVNAPVSRHKGFTALQAACIADTKSNSITYTNHPLVELLLTAGANTDAPGSRYLGASALHAAAHMGHADIVQHLLSAGTSVNLVAGPSQQTPLQTALFNDQ